MVMVANSAQGVFGEFSVAIVSPTNPGIDEIQGVFGEFAPIAAVVFIVGEVVYTPEPRPSQLLRDLLLTNWDIRTDGSIPRPIIIEKPPPDYQRADIRNEGDHIWVSLEGFQERPLTIAFGHREITTDMLMHCSVFTSRQRLYDYINEVRRIIYTKQHNPDDYLLDGFESYADSTALNVVWADTTGNSTITLDTGESQFGNQGMQVVTAGGDGEVYRALPFASTNDIPLVPQPFPGRLRRVRFFAHVDSGSPVIGVTLRDASNRTGLFRTWNVTITGTSFVEYRVDFDDTADDSTGVWDESLIDEIAFTSIDSGRTLDIDHIDLSTEEFQFIQYNGYEEMVEDFEFFEADIRASFRSHGDVVPEQV